MYRYTQKIKLKDSISWRFIPPQDAINAGIVTRQTFKDGRTARYEIPRLIKRVEAFRNGELVAGNVGPASNLMQVYKYYSNTTHFKSLAPNSQKNYDYTMSAIVDTVVYNKPLGLFKISSLNGLNCSEAYTTWVEDVSVSKANQCSRMLSLLINFCISMNIIQYNPMSAVKKLKHETQSVVWMQQEVEDFLEVSFSKFRWRNIGLIAMMCYEWAQRPNDIRLLKWSSININKEVVTIKQTKRGATVELPISTELIIMLIQQKKDWGFQDYVVPYERPADRAYRPLERSQISYLANEVKEVAELPPELKIGGLRKSGIVEMIDAGVDHLQIMSVTGHQNISSLGPYQKHTLTAAKSALDKRKGHEKT